MKRIIAILLVTLIGQSVFSQEIEKCKEIVKITTEAINKKSLVELEEHLSSDFEIANQKGKIAKRVLKQLFTQLDDIVQSYKKINAETSKNTLTLTYSIVYEKMGRKNATFIFNEHNKLTKLELFKMEVKTMNNSEREISKPNNEIIIIPFFMIGNLIAVNVTLNNEIRTFLFDSGSPSLILNSKYLQKKDTINKKTLSSSKGVNGGISGMDIEKIEEIDFYGIKILNQKVLTLDLSHIENSLNTKIYGLIGYEIIKDYDILFDYKNKTITLIVPEQFEQFRENHLSNKDFITVPISLEKHIPVIKSLIGTNQYLFGIDCGAEVNLMDDNLYGKVKKHFRKIKKDTLKGADNNSEEVISGKIKKMIIGQKKFKNMNTVFNDISHLNNGYKIKLDGLLGYEFLSNQKTLISFRRKQLILIE